MPYIFLGDEVSGSVFNYSHQKVYSAYAGNVVRVNGVDYAFSGNQVDLAAIVAANPVDATVNTFYDQAGTFDLAALGTPVFDASEGDFVNTNAGQPRLQSNTGIFSDGAFSVVLVTRRLGNPAAGLEFQFGLESSLNANYRSLIRRGSADSVRFELLDAGSSPIIIAFGVPTGFADNEKNLFIVTNDGTQNANSINCYHQSSIATSLASNPSSYTITSFQFNRISIGGRYSGANDFNGLVFEFHLFDHALDLTERQKVLQFMEQRYTLPTS